MTTESPQYRHLVVCALSAILAIVLCMAGPALAQSGIELYMRDTVGYPGQTLLIPLMLNNHGDADTIAAFQFGYGMDRPNVGSFTQVPGVDTTLFCLNPPECTVFDTSISTSPLVLVDTAGTLVSGWELLSATSPVTDLEMRVTAIADTDFDQFPLGISPLTIDQHLLTISVRLLCPPDPFQGDAVVLFGQGVISHFSNPRGDLITPVSLPSMTITVLQFIPGDQDFSGLVDAVDLSEFIECVFFGGCPSCSAIPTDFNCDGQPDSVDLSNLIDYIYFGGADLLYCP